MPQKELQQKMMEYQMLEEKFKQMNQQRELFESKMIELEQTNQAIEDIEKSKKEDDILIPLGSGLFLPGKISKKEKMVIGIGADIVIEKDSDEVKKVLEERRKILENGMENIQNNMLQIAREMQRLQVETQKMMPKQEQAG